MLLCSYQCPVVCACRWGTSALDALFVDWRNLYLALGSLTCFASEWAPTLLYMAHRAVTASLHKNGTCLWCGVFPMLHDFLCCEGIEAVLRVHQYSLWGPWRGTSIAKMNRLGSAYAKCCASFSALSWLCANMLGQSSWCCVVGVESFLVGARICSLLDCFLISMQHFSYINWVYCVSSRQIAVLMYLEELVRSWVCAPWGHAYVDSAGHTGCMTALAIYPCCMSRLVASGVELARLEGNAHIKGQDTCGGVGWRGPPCVTSDPHHTAVIVTRRRIDALSLVPL